MDQDLTTFSPKRLTDEIAWREAEVIRCEASINHAESRITYLHPQLAALRAELARKTAPPAPAAIPDPV